MSTARSNFSSLAVFLAAKPDCVRTWLAERPVNLILFCVGTIMIGAGAYGAVMGCWHQPLQSLYTGIKLPLVILLTTLGNGLLNGMLAPLLGFNATFRQSLTVVLMTFAIASLILGALSPVAFFVIWNTPPLTSATSLSSPEYGFMQLMLVLFIASAGVVGNAQLLPLITQWTRSMRVARKVLVAWLAGNLFLGSQICWVLRPFIWDPAGQPRFIGREYVQGSFFETVFEAARRLIFN